MGSALDVVREAYEHYRHGRLDAVLEACADDVAWRSIGPAADIPWTGDYRGRDAVRGWFEMLGGHISVESYDIRRFIAQDEWVVVLSDVTARFKRGGPSVQFDKCDVMRVADGKIVEFVEFFDTAAVKKLLEGGGTMLAYSAEPVAASLV